MTKRIFRSICLVALCVFLASLVLIMGVLYSYFGNIQQEQLRTQADLAAQGVEQQGLAYFDGLEVRNCRITWVAPDGTVLYDTDGDISQMENHLEREEITEALASGWGESVRHSNTLTERMVYYAERLADGSVVRAAMAQSTALNLVLGMAQPICVVFAVALVLSLVLASRLSRKIVKPLNQLDLDDPLNCDAYDELSPLLRRIDSQQKQLKIKSADLRRKQEEFETVTAGMNEGLVLLGSQDTVLSINPAAARVFGADKNCVGKDFLTVNRSPEVLAVLQKAHEGSQAETMLNLQEREYRLDVSPVTADGVITGLVLLLFDVTEKERAEQMRREFTANVSHELKTPLHAISGYAELMAQGIARQEDMASFSRNIYGEAQRMIELIGDILRLSQLDEGAGGFQWEQTELMTLAKQEVRSLQSAADQAGVTVTLGGDHAVLVGIPELLGAIIHNLCDNAIKYNRPGGKVRVHIAAGEQITLTVADTGIGIPAASRERVFERFYRVDKSRSKAVGGTGLGLSIVKHAVMIHGGRIDLQSTPGTGTTMIVTLPRRQE